MDEDEYERITRAEGLLALATLPTSFAVILSALLRLVLTLAPLSPWLFPAALAVSGAASVALSSLAVDAYHARHAR